MSRVFAALVCLLVSVPVFAQDVFPPRHTTAPNDARFEVLPSSNSSYRTYRVNRLTGQVDELDTQNATPIWHQCEFRELTPDTGTVPRYQLLTTGLFSNEVLLVDTFSGRTWIKAFGEVITPGRNDHRTIWVPLK
jgi:hypothetical protein